MADNLEAEIASPKVLDKGCVDHDGKVLLPVPYDTVFLESVIG
jgi:hypothetical protein